MPQTPQIAEHTLTLETARFGPFTFQVGCRARPSGLSLDYAFRWREVVVQPEAYPALWRTWAEATGPGRALVLLEAAP